MNIAFYKDNVLICFLKNYTRDGRTYIGENGVKYQPGKNNVLDTLYTLDDVDQNDDEFNPLKYTPVPVFDDIKVDSRDAVNKITVSKIEKIYSKEDEAKIFRLKLSGALSDEVWSKYKENVERIVQDGNDFKDKHFPKGE